MRRPIYKTAFPISSPSESSNPTLPTPPVSPLDLMTQPHYPSRISSTPASIYLPQLQPKQAPYPPPKSHHYRPLSLTMDLLINDLGSPPYQITVFESVLRDGQAILERARERTLDDAVPDSEITKAIERLEALASICFRAMEMDFITYTMDYSTNSMDPLAVVIWGLKQHLLRPRSGQGVGQVEGADGNVCRFCGWALERIGVGVGGMSSVPNNAIFG